MLKFRLGCLLRRQKRAWTLWLLVVAVAAWIVLWDGQQLNQTLFVSSSWKEIDYYSSILPTIRQERYQNASATSHMGATHATLNTENIIATFETTNEQHPQDPKVLDVPDGASVKNATNATETTNTTAVAVVAFANATKTRLVERLVRSVQSRGEWNRSDIPIVIFTDNRGHYENVFGTNTSSPIYTGQNPIVVLYPQQQDWDDIPDTDFKVIKLKYKRFKTLLADYMDLDERLSSVQRILYLDIDIVVCQPLTPFVEKYWKKYASSNERTKKNDKNKDNNNKRDKNKPSASWMMAFPGKAGQGKTVHSGILLLDRKHSKGCLKRWRYAMDQGRQTYKRDQEILRAMRNHRLPEPLRHKWAPNCEFLLFQRTKHEMLFPEPADFQPGSDFPVFLHITNTHHVHLTNATVQQAYLEDALQLTDEERRSNMSLAFTGDTF